MATALGDHAALPALEQNLREELAMQDWLEKQIEPTTRKFLSLEEQGMSAKV